MKERIKRTVSLCLSIVLALQICMTVPVAAVNREESEPAASQQTEISADTEWAYLDDGSDPAGDKDAAGYDRISWTKASFDDAGWKTGTGSFGAKNGEAFSGANNKLEGCPGNEYNIPTYYFRTKVNVTDASAVTKITGTIAYDDAVILYINGVKVKGFNDDGCDSNSSFCTNIASASPVTGDFTITDDEALAALKDGENVVAVELHNRAEGSSDIYFAMPDMTFSTVPLPVETQLLTGDATWTYLDDNTDPAASSNDRTSWTAETFDTTGWKTASGPFGSKKGAAELETGYTADTVLDGCNGSNNTPAYFFRTTFNVTSLDGMTKLVGELQYDDGVIVYINGQRVAAFDDNACDADGNSLNKGFDDNLQYGGSNAGTPKTVSFELTDLSILHTGGNTIAVELHNGRQTSSDVWFAMTDLSLSDEEVTYQSNISLSMGADESQMNFTWYSPLNDAELLVSANADMTEAQTFTATATLANDGQYSCKATATGLRAGTTYYYQLSSAGYKSTVYSFTTDDGGDFSFAFVGDPQIGASGNVANDSQGWEKTLNLIATNDIFSDVSFLMSAGDQVNTANDENQYDAYLDHDVLTGLPVATVIGNHDTSSVAYDEHFNVPNESGTLGQSTAGGDYYFVYKNALFLVLNSNNLSTAEHCQFMKDAIAATADQEIQWKIVTFHHSIYSVATHATEDDILQRRSDLVPVFEELGIDVVLMGHDHVYVRTFMMDGLNPITEADFYTDVDEDGVPEAATDPDGILYVTANSASGSKYYEIQSAQFPYAAVMNQEHTPNISRVDITDDSFTVTTYRTTDMSEVDSFTIKRTASEGLQGNGTEASPYKIRTEGDLVFAATQMNENNLAYTGKYYILTKDIDMRCV